MDKAFVDKRLTEAESRWNNAITRRETLDQVVHRELPPIVDSHLASRISSYQTPDVEKEEQNLADVLTMNPTRFDSVQGKPGKDAERDANNHRLVHARAWNIMNPGRRFDRRVAVGQARHGYEWTRLLCRDDEPPDDMDYEEWEQNRQWPWYLANPSNLTCMMFEGDQGIEWVVQKYEAPITGDDLKAKGEKVGKDKGKYYVPIADKASASGLTWVGLSEREDADNKGTTETITVTVFEYRDRSKPCPVCIDRHPLWSGVEIVCASGKKLVEGDVINEYTLPYRHAGTYRFTPGRLADIDSHDPHYQFRPYLYPLMVEAQAINWATSVLQTITSRDSAQNAKMVELASSLPDGVHFPEGFAEKWTIPLPDSNSREIPVVPGKLVQWPADLAEALIQYIELAYKRYEEHKVPRFLLGTNFQEAEKGAATSNVSATQQASLPFDWLLSQSDATIQQIHEDIDHAILYWDYESTDKEETKYFVRLVGDENLAKGSAQGGEHVYLSASRLKSRPQIVLKTENETLAEQAEKTRQALELYAAKRIDDEQLDERLGFTDTEAQAHRRAKQFAREQAMPIQAAMIQNAITLIATELAEMDPAMLMPGGGMPQIGGQGNAVQEINVNPRAGTNVNVPAISRASGGGQATEVR